MLIANFVRVFGRNNFVAYVRWKTIGGSNMLKWFVTRVVFNRKVGLTSWSHLAYGAKS